MRKFYLLKPNPFLRHFVSTNNCACLFRVFLVGTSSSSSESGIAEDDHVGNFEKSGTFSTRTALPSNEVVIDIVSSYKV